MAKNLMTENGTIHAYSTVTKKSREGRWSLDNEGARLTTKAVTCGRCIQLNAKDDGTEAPAKVVKSDAPVKRVAKKVSKAAASKVVDVDTLKSDGTMYEGFNALLEHNDIDSVISTGPDGTSLDMTIGAWQYRVFAPQYATSGKWTIVYSEDMGSDQNEEVFDSEGDALTYLIDDAILEPLPKQAPKKVAKATAARKVVKGTDGDVKAVDALLTASITSAKAAYDVARTTNVHSEDHMKALFDMITAATELRKVMN